jgi:hypothetical protein
MLSVVSMRDPIALASDPPLRVSASGSDSVHIGVGAPGGLTIDSRGSPLAQPPLVPRDHSPFRLGPVKTPITQGPVAPMGLATKRANLMASGLPLNVISIIQYTRASSMRGLYVYKWQDNGLVSAHGFG